mmetsp:Transcript_56195/g.134144  ORF Transcript_56195/g.134144 Transcript_56195/m.134144 type:complete len:276 (-) Transcript_56195:63-890(-)
MRRSCPGSRPRRTRSRPGSRGSITRAGRSARWTTPRGRASVRRRAGRRRGCRTQQWCAWSRPASRRWRARSSLSGSGQAHGPRPSPTPQSSSPSPPPTTQPPAGPPSSSTARNSGAAGPRCRSARAGRRASGRCGSRRRASCAASRRAGTLRGAGGALWRRSRACPPRSRTPCRMMSRRFGARRDTTWGRTPFPRGDTPSRPSRASVSGTTSGRSGCGFLRTLGRRLGGPRCMLSRRACRRATRPESPPGASSTGSAVSANGGGPKLTDLTGSVD